MTEKHTPGPWHYTENDMHVYSTDITRFQVCRTPNKKHSTNPRWHADARLIAAAPDLLEALKQAVLWLEDDRFGDDCIPEQWYHDARAAIAKARGDEA